MSTSIKACPFCGSDDIKTPQHRSSGNWEIDYDYWSVCCCDCGSCIQAMTQIDAIEQWNRRENDNTACREIISQLKSRFENAKHDLDGRDTNLDHSTRRISAIMDTWHRAVKIAQSVQNELYTNSVFPTTRIANHNHQP